jgi:hypothetical protein
MIVHEKEEVNIIQKIKPLLREKQFKIIKIEDTSGKKPVEIEKKVEISNESDMLKISLIDSNDSGEIKYEIKEARKKLHTDAAFFGSLSERRSQASQLRSREKLTDKRSGENSVRSGDRPQSGHQSRGESLKDFPHLGTTVQDASLSRGDTTRPNPFAQHPRETSGQDTRGPTVSVSGGVGMLASASQVNVKQISFDPTPGEGAGTSGNNMSGGGAPPRHRP